MKRPVLSVAALFGPLLLLLGVFSVLRLDVWMITQVVDRPLVHVKGHGYLLRDAVQIPFGPLFYTPSDRGGGDLTASRLQVLQAGRVLERAHASHDDIAVLGNGRYLHWKDRLYVSMLDNADPAAAGALELRYPVRLRLSAALALGLGWMALLYWRRPGLVRAAFGVINVRAAFGVTNVRAAFGAINVRAAFGAINSLVDSRIATGTWWACAGGLIVVAIALRWAWTTGLGVPYGTPDSASYMHAADSTLSLPLSEVRTAGMPLALRLSFLLSGGPEGILLLHHAVWAISTLAVVLALYFQVQWRLAALGMLVYLAFVQKNLAFEYLLMSEHLSRCLYLLFLVAWLRWGVSGPAPLRLAVGGALLVIIGILVKPSALVLLPAGLIGFVVLAWRSDGEVRRNCILASGCFAGIVLAGMLGYGLYFKAAFGTFGLSSFTGFNLYSHVGHLTDLDGPAHRPLKKRLTPLLTRYREAYSERGEHQPNWLVYGSVNEQLRADFGDDSPFRAVREYVAEVARPQAGFGFSEIREINHVFLDLAIEAILNSPLDYMTHSAQRAWVLVRYGTGFQYGETLAPSSASWHERGARELFSLPQAREGGVWSQGGWFDSHGYRPPHAVDAEHLSRDRAVLQQVQAGFHAAAFAALHVGRVLLFTPVAACLLLLPLSWRRAARTQMTTGMCLLVVAGYVALLGLLNVAEPLRFMVNVQDLLIIAGLGAGVTVMQIAGGWSGIFGYLAGAHREPAAVNARGS